MSAACRVCGSDETAFLIGVPAQMHPTREDFAFSQCASCGYVFIDPPVPVEELKRYYTASYYPYRGASAWGRHAALVARDDAKLDLRRVAWARELGGLSAGKLLLDVGCGRPTFLRAAAETVGCDAAGLDFSDDGWRGDDSFKKLSLIAGDIDALPDDIAPDVVTMWHYLEHDYDPEATLRLLAARAKKGARLIAEVPDYESEGRRRHGKHWAGWHAPRHVSLFSEKNLRMLVEKSGWRVVEIRRSGTLDPYVLEWMSQMEKRGIDWSGDFEKELVGFVARIPLFRLRTLFAKDTGLLTVVGEKLESSV